MKAIPLLLAEAFPFSPCAWEMEFLLSYAYRERGEIFKRVYFRERGFFSYFSS